MCPPVMAENVDVDGLELMQHLCQSPNLGCTTGVVSHPAVTEYPNLLNAASIYG